ncbi:MAG: hypothetical protein ACK4JE_03530 [Endomicrobiia bacterium]
MKFFLASLVLIFIYNISFSQVDFGIGIDFSPYPYFEESKEQKEEKKLPPDPLIEKISKKFEQDTEKLNNLFRRGYGYLELIKILLIVKESGKDIEEILKLRERKQKLADIAKKFNLEYEKIYNMAYIIKSEVEEDKSSVLSSTNSVIEPANQGEK